MESSHFGVQRHVARLPFLPLVDHLLGDAQAEDGGRHPGVEHQLDEYPLDLLRGDAHGEAGAHLVLHAEIVAVDALGGDGGETAQLQIQPVGQPDAAPHQLVLHPHEIGQHWRGPGVGQMLVEKRPQLSPTFPATLVPSSWQMPSFSCQKRLRRSLRLCVPNFQLICRVALDPIRSPTTLPQTLPGPAPARLPRGATLDTNRPGRTPRRSPAG